MSTWQQVACGGFTDGLITNFGPITLPAPDSRLCLTLHYSGRTAGQVIFYLAAAPAGNLEDHVIVYDSALQTNPGANQTSSFTGLVVDVFVNPTTRIPLNLYATIASANANAWWAADVKLGPGC